jgi:hypothetical protein
MSQVADQPRDAVVNTVAADTNVIVDSTSTSRGRPFRRYRNLNSLIQTITLRNATSLASSTTSRVLFKTLLIYSPVS